MSGYDQIARQARRRSPPAASVDRGDPPAVAEQRKPQSSGKQGPCVDVDGPGEGVAAERLVWRPFPVEVLPEPLRRYVTEGARAIGCDPCFLAGPVLVACAAAVGNSRRVQLKRGWSEPSVVWLALVGASGEHKSPALELALRPLRDLQRQALEGYAEAEREFREVTWPTYEKDLAAWKRVKGTDPPPEPPEAPWSDRLLVDDVTIEALAGLLQNQPRGLLLAMDELAGWFGGFDRYRAKGAGGDVAKWLEIHGGRMLLIDRKTGSPKVLCIPHAAVSVVGGIQPEILRAALTAQHRENGLSARLLVCRPPRRRKRWTDAEIDPRTVQAFADVLERLRTLSLDQNDQGEFQPRVVGLDDRAKERFVTFYNEHADEQAELQGELSAAWSKLEAYAPRLALVIQLVKQAHAGIDPDLDTRIDAEAMQAGITLARWFGHEKRRVHALLAGTDEERKLRELVEWIQQHGGKTTPRVIMQQLSRYRTSAELAEGDLQQLVKAGLGRWVIARTRGRPSTVFELASNTSTQAADAGENGTCADGDVPPAPRRPAEPRRSERPFTESEISAIAARVP